MNYRGIYGRIISIRAGNLLSLFGIASALTLMILLNQVQSLLLRILAALVSWLCLWFFSHCLTHYLIGSILGIRFENYFIARSSIRKLDLPVVKTLAEKLPTLGIKIDRQSMKHISLSRRVAMYRSGALASMMTPLIVPPYLYMVGRFEEAFITFLVSIGNILFTIYYSPRAGDFFKAKRTLKAS